MLESWLEDEIASVPEIEVFETVDEMTSGLEGLARAHGDISRLRRVGTSRLGDPILGLTIDGPLAAESAPDDAIVIGLPHPNEPIGGLTSLHLARRLCEDADLRDRLGHRWHIVACIDPDGLRLNEGWLKGPLTREHYARHFYRPAGDEQVEWTFPLSYKDAYFDAVLPETLAVMRLVDEHRPALLCSLHNSELGGAYYYLSRPEPALHPVLQEIPERLGLSLDRGEPEAPWLSRFADGIFEMLDIKRMYDYQEARGELRADAIGGNSSAPYAKRHGTLTLLSEVPYWTDDRAGDDARSGLSYADALRAQALELAEMGGLMVGVLDAVRNDVKSDSPYLRASRYFAPGLVESGETIQRRADEAESERPATVAEVASLNDLVHSFRLRFPGMLLRALDGELAIGNVTPTIRRERARLAERFEVYLAEAVADSSAEALPIRSLVATQYGALTATANHLHRQRMAAWSDQP